MRIIFTLFLSFIACNILAQTPQNSLSVEDAAFSNYYQNPDNIPKVTGKITHMPVGSHKKAKIKYAIVTASREFHENKVANVSEDGTFKLKLDHAVPYQQIWLTMGPYYGALYVKDGLEIELDLEKINNKKVRFYGDAISFNGPDAAITTLMNKHILFKREQQLELSSAEQKLNRNLPYSEYKIKYDSIYNLLKDLDTDFINQNPSDYSWLIKNERLSDYYSNLTVKHWNKKMDDTLWNKIKEHKAFAVSNNGMSFYNYLFTYLETLNRIWLGPEDLLSIKGLSKNEKKVIQKAITLSKNAKAGQPTDSTEAEATRKILSPLYQDLYDKRRSKQKNIVFKTIDSCFAAPKADLLKLRMKDKDPKIQKEIDQAALKSMTTPWCIDELQNLAKENQLRLKEIEAILQNATVENTKSTLLGKPAMEFDFGASLYHIKDTNATDLLSKIKSSFKNKALLLDFWAVWCGPCLQEFPYSKKLHDAVREKPIEFIYLCTAAGGSVEKWQNKIAEYKLDGIHLFVEGVIATELMQLFNGQGFPTYAFIDKNGVYQPGSINRMSHTQVEDLVRLIDAK